MPDFRRVSSLMERQPRTFEAGGLPDAEKEKLCRSLLAEFGVTKINARGDELIHSCPLPFGGHKHGDAHPSASLNFRKLVFACLGCQNAGGLLWFIGVCRGTDGTESRRWLARETGTGAEEQGLASLLAYFDAVYSPRQDHSGPMPRMNPAVLEPWLAIHPYMTEVRGVPEETLMRFRVGWNSETNRIVVPLFWRGDLVGWQTRRIVNDGSEKYKSSPDLPKDRTIFNYDPRRPAVVVESMLSVLRHWHQCPEMEATIGAALTDKQLRLIAQHSRVTLWMDNDAAGWNATERLGSYLQDYCDVWVVESPLAADPGDLDDRTFTDLLGGAVPFASWAIPQKLFAWDEAA